MIKLSLENVAPLPELVRMHISIARFWEVLQNKKKKKSIEFILTKHFPKLFDMGIFHWIASPLDQALGNAALLLAQYHIICQFSLIPKQRLILFFLPKPVADIADTLSQRKFWNLVGLSPHLFIPSISPHSVSLIS